MRRGLVSDIHGCWRPLKEALEIFYSKDVNKIFCTGDIFDENKPLKENKKTLDLIKGYNGEIISVLGDHDQEIKNLPNGNDEIKEYLKGLDERKRVDDILLVHAISLKYKKENDLNEILRKVGTTADIIIRGHDHKKCPSIYDKDGFRLIEKRGVYRYQKPVIIHGGCLISSKLHDKELFNPTCAILDTDKYRVEFFFL